MPPGARAFLRPLLSICWIAAGAALVMTTASAAAAIPSAPFRLTSPTAGETWRAGRQVTLAWEPAGPSGQEAAGGGLAAVEWEAFLSVDGGTHYSVRLTPHLDVAVRRFTFEVPHLPTRQARLLLRFGDERREMPFEIPMTLAIVDEAPGAVLWNGELPLWSSHPGEAARERDPGTVIWLEGSRRGGALRVEVSVPIRRSVGGSRLEVRLPLFLLGGWMPLRDPLPPLSESGEPAPVTAFRGGESLAAPERLSSLPIRLLIHRFNE
jgi:hypothetical protein